MCNSGLSSLRQQIQENISWSDYYLQNGRSNIITLYHEGQGYQAIALSNPDQHSDGTAMISSTGFWMRSDGHHQSRELAMEALLHQVETELEEIIPASVSEKRSAQKTREEGNNEEEKEGEALNSQVEQLKVLQTLYQTTKSEVQNHTQRIKAIDSRYENLLTEQSNVERCSLQRESLQGIDGNAILLTLTARIKSLEDRVIENQTKSLHELETRIQLRTTETRWRTESGQALQDWAELYEQNGQNEQNEHQFAKINELEEQRDSEGELKQRLTEEVDTLKEALQKEKDAIQLLKEARAKEKEEWLKADKSRKMKIDELENRLASYVEKEKKDQRLNEKKEGKENVVFENLLWANSSTPIWDPFLMTKWDADFLTIEQQLKRIEKSLLSSTTSGEEIATTKNVLLPWDSLCKPILELYERIGSFHRYKLPVNEQYEHEVLIDEKRMNCYLMMKLLVRQLQIFTGPSLGDYFPKAIQRYRKFPLPSIITAENPPRFGETRRALASTLRQAATTRVAIER